MAPSNVIQYQQHKCAMFINNSLKSTLKKVSHLSYSSLFRDSLLHFIVSPFYVETFIDTYIQSGILERDGDLLFYSDNHLNTLNIDEEVDKSVIKN